MKGSHVTLVIHLKRSRFRKVDNREIVDFNALHSAPFTTQYNSDQYSLYNTGLQ